MNNQQKIVQALTKIKESQSKFKVKTSKYLKLLDIFKLNLNLEEIKLFLCGNQQLPYGLLYCCGNKSKVDSSLRKSAFYSTELLLSLFEKHPQNQLFIKVFADLDDDDYKQMALSTHVMADKNFKDKGLIAYKIIKYLKDQRPHADLSNLLESTRLQTQFNLWYSKQKTQQIQEQIQQNTWKDQEVPTENNLNLQRQQTKKQKKLEQISLQFDGSSEYLIKTFYNPFKLQQRVSKSKKNREAAMKKKQIADSLNAVVDEDSIAFLKQNVKNLDQIIGKIHLDSSTFDAKAFIKIIQPQINRNSLAELHMQNEDMNKNIVYYFIDDFFSINQSILRIQRELIGKEFKEIQKRNKQKDQQQFDESMIISTLQRGAFTLLSRLGSISKSMNQLRLNQQNLRLVLDFIRRSQSYMSYPAQLKEAFLQRDNEKIIKLVQQFKNTKYEQITVFSQLNIQIELILKDIYEDMLNQIQIHIRDYQQLSLLAQYAIQLNKNAKTDIVQKLQFTILSSFNQYFNKQKQVGDYQIESIKGDYVLEFLQQCTQLPNNQLINVQIIEQYINNSFKEQYKNYQQLMKSLQLQEQGEMKQQINETFLKFLETFNRNDNESNKNVYVKMQQDLVSIKSIVNTILQLMGPMFEIVEKLNEIEVKALGEEFKNVTLKQIKCVFLIPQKDFFGINFSQSVSQIIFELSKICKNRNVNGSFLLNLLMDSLLHIKNKLKESKDYLIFLHNIRLIVQQLKDIGGNIYQITKKQINQKEFLQSLMNNQILQTYYQPVLQKYVKLIPFELPLPMDIIPRPYIIDWLTLLNQQALIMAQLNTDVIIMDSLIAYVISIFFKLVEQSVQKKEKIKFLQQLHKEIGLFQAMTTLFQGQVSNEGFQRVYKKIQEYSQGELNDISEWVELENFILILLILMLFQDTERVVEYKRFTLTKPVKPPTAHDSPEVSFALGFDTFWRTHSLQIFYQITKFIIRLKKAADDYKFKLITKRIHDIIGDVSSDYLFYQSHGLVKAKWTIYQSIRRIFETMMPSYKISVIQPDSPFKLLLNCIVLVLIVINIFYIPMQLAFDIETDQDTPVDFLLNALPSWVFLMEIILNFNTAYYSEGMIHQSRSLIFKHYVKGDFIWDLIVVIPFFISQYKIPYINFVLLLRMTRVERIFEQIEEITLIREKFAASIDLIKLMYFLILVAHMCGCAWHYLGMQEISNGDHNNWLEKYEYVDKDWSIRYQASLYFGTITAFTIGYGDIVPQSPLEQTFVTFMVLATSIIFGYTISSIQVIFAKLREESDLHRNNMAIVSSYLKKHKISPMLQMKIKKYFEYYFTVTDGPEKLMEGLTDDLRHDLKASIFGPLLKTCPLFNRFDESVIRELSRIVNVEKYIPGQNIFGQSSQCGKVYFIISGNIETQINKSILKQMDRGTLGTREFYLGKNIKYSAKATQFSELAYIDFEKFIETIKQNEKSYEMYCLIRDELMFEHLPVQCQICSRSHNYLDCPVVFYNPCKVKLVSDQRLSIASSRQNHKRGDRRQNSLLNLQENIEGALDAAMDNGLIQEDLNQDLLNRVGYALKHQQSERSMDSHQRQQCAQVVEYLKQSKSRTKKTFEIPTLILREKSQVEQLYEDFLQFKKEDIQVDKQGVFQVYHQNENFNKIIQEMGVGQIIRKKNNRQRSRVSRMKTFYKKS